MDLTLTAHYEIFIAAANVLNARAQDFEALNTLDHEGTNSRLAYKIRELRQLAQSINDQVMDELHPTA